METNATRLFARRHKTSWQPNDACASFVRIYTKLRHQRKNPIKELGAVEGRPRHYAGNYGAASRFSASFRVRILSSVGQKQPPTTGLAGPVRMAPFDYVLEGSQERINRTPRAPAGSEVASYLPLCFSPMDGRGDVTSEEEPPAKVSYWHRGRRVLESPHF